MRRRAKKNPGERRGEKREKNKLTGKQNNETKK